MPEVQLATTSKIPLGGLCLFGSAATEQKLMLHQDKRFRHHFLFDFPKLAMYIIHV